MRCWRLFYCAVIIVLLIGGWTTDAYGQKDHLYHQGVISDYDGGPLAGEYEITFRFYNVDQGGEPVWEETQSVDFQNGVYFVELGKENPFQEKLFNGHDMYLGITVEDDSEMYPRLALYSMPFAKSAEVANTALSLDAGAVLSRLVIEGFGEVINSYGEWVGPSIAGGAGLDGDKGDKGDTGAQGPQGLKGDKGDTGAQGLKGDKGDTGAEGPQGPAGEDEGGLYTVKADLYVDSAESDTIAVAKNSFTDESVQAICNDENDIAISGGCRVNVTEWQKRLNVYIAGSYPISWEDDQSIAGWYCGAHADNNSSTNSEFSVTATVYCIAVP